MDTETSGDTFLPFQATDDRIIRIMSNEEPLSKKPKSEVSKIKLGWKPKPILAEELIRSPVLEKSFIGVLKEKRYISQAIACLANFLPNPQHLKRCSGLKIYLAPIAKSNGDAEELKALMLRSGFDLSILEDDFLIAEVPSTPPRTKSQMSEVSKFWPVNFHPDQSLEAVISGAVFEHDQLTSLEACMRLVISAAEIAATGTKECNGSALIVDPIEGKILSIAAASIDRHPMWHASMLAVDLVAKHQGGGCWTLSDDTENQVSQNKRMNENVLPLVYPNSLSELEQPKNSTLVFATKDKQINMSRERVDDEKCGPYLCTGYWVILLQEPCPLCAMALLHSRVSRIFYGAPNPNTGILGSRVTLHSVPGLNHRYQVWGGVLEDECTRALEKCRILDVS